MNIHFLCRKDMMINREKDGSVRNNLDDIGHNTIHLKYYLMDYQILKPMKYQPIMYIVKILSIGKANSKNMGGVSRYHLIEKSESTNLIIPKGS